MELVNKIHKLLESSNDHTVETLQDVVSQLIVQANELKDALEKEVMDTKREQLEEEYRAVQRLLHKSQERLMKFTKENEQ
jgi:hypothetical protein